MGLLITFPVFWEICKQYEKKYPKCGSDFSKNVPYSDASQTSYEITKFVDDQIDLEIPEK